MTVLNKLIVVFILFAISITGANCDTPMSSREPLDIDEEPEYEPQQSHLGILYYGDLEDTILVGRQTAYIIKAVAVDTLHFDSTGKRIVKLP